jgi:hypothetical protein
MQGTHGVVDNLQLAGKLVELNIKQDGHKKAENKST